MNLTSGLQKSVRHKKLHKNMRDASGNLQLLFTEMISGEECLSRNLIKEWEQGENAEVR